MATTQVSIAELLGSGVRLTAGEAVAIIRAALTAQLDPTPAGEPSRQLQESLAETLAVKTDGTIVWLGYTPHSTVSDMALLLRSLIPEDANTPGGLRYAIARALREVDAPPFGSTEDFSKALARFEAGDSQAICRRLAAGTTTDKNMPLRVPNERRRPSGATVSNLRHALREADARLYEQRQAPEPNALPAAPEPSHARRGWAIAACLAAAVVLFAAGATTRDALRSPAPPPGATAASTVQVRDIELKPEPPKTPVKAVLKKNNKVRLEAASARTPRSTASAKPGKSGFFERMHLQWLRKPFS